MVVIGLAGGWLAPRPEPTRRAPTAVILEPPQGMRAIDVEVTASEPAVVERPDDPERPEPEESPAPERVAVTEAVPDTMAADDITAAERLAPRIVDPRLWQPMILIPLEPTIEDVEARVAAAVELLSDSALAAADAAMRARDWTVEDKDGGRWGISPGQIHLGSITLPLPIWFPQDPEAAAEQRMWLELDQQLDRARVLESFQERVRAIRERRERERTEARGGGGSGGGGGG